MKTTSTGLILLHPYLHWLHFLCFCIAWLTDFHHIFRLGCSFVACVQIMIDSLLQHIILTSISFESSSVFAVLFFVSLSYIYPTFASKAVLGFCIWLLHYLQVGFAWFPLFFFFASVLLSSLHLHLTFFFHLCLMIAAFPSHIHLTLLHFLCVRFI